MRQAKNTAEDKKIFRRQRSREERRSRETRVKERRKESKEREDEDLKIRRVAIETKDKRVKKEIQINYFIVRFQKVDNMLNEREKSIERKRRLATKTADIKRTMR